MATYILKINLAILFLFDPDTYSTSLFNCIQQYRLAQFLPIATKVKRTVQYTVVRIIYYEICGNMVTDWEFETAER